jgi:hypothetical protein
MLHDSWLGDLLSHAHVRSIDAHNYEAYVAHDPIPIVIISLFMILKRKGEIV